MSVRKVARAVLLAGASACVVSAFAQDNRGWSKPGMTDSRPHMMYAATQSGAPSFSVTCELAGNINFFISGLVAQQQWPQPPLTVRLGSVERAKRPDLRWLQGLDGYPDRTGFAVQFPITDSVLGALANGSEISVHLADQSQSFPTPPEALRREFARKCEALVPAGMRKG